MSSGAQKVNFESLSCLFTKRGQRLFLSDPRSRMTPIWGFRVATHSVGTLCFYQAHFGRTMLPKWPLWAHLFYPVFYSVSELRRICFREARAARAVLPPAVVSCRAFACPPCAPKPTCTCSHIWGFPIF